MQKLINNAWILVKQRGMTLSEAMKLAWKVYYIKTKGANGKVEFDYIKKSTGELRHAVGTFKAIPVPKKTQNESKDVNYTVPPLQVRYFDIEKQGWRSCVEENIVAVY